MAKSWFFGFHLLLSFVILVSPYTSGINKISQIGDYNVVSLVSFTSLEVPTDVQRLHLRLRYFIARQKGWQRCSSVGFVAYNVRNSRDNLLEAILDIQLGTQLNTLAGLVHPLSSVLMEHSKCKGSCFLTNVIAVVSMVPDSFVPLIAGSLSFVGIPLFPYSVEITSSEKHSSSSLNLLLTDVEEVVEDAFSMGVHEILLLKLPNSNPQLSEIHRDIFWKVLKSYSLFTLIKYDMVSISDKEIHDFLVFLYKKTSAELIVIWSNQRSWELMMNNIEYRNDRAWYWYLEAGISNPMFFKTFSSNSTVTHLLRLQSLFAYQILNVYFPNKELKRKVTMESYYDILHDPWIPVKDGLVDVSHFSKESSLRTFIIDSLILPIWYFQPASVICGKTSKLTMMHELLKSYGTTFIISFIGNGRFFAKTPNSYKIVLRKIIKSSPSRLICQPGYESLKTVFNKSNHRVQKYDWLCFPCKRKHVKPWHSNASCIKCKSYLVNDLGHRKCLDPFLDDYNMLSGIPTALLITLNIMYIAMTLISITCLLKYRNTPIVRAKSFASSMISLTNHAVIGCILPFLFLTKPSKVLCYCQVFLPAVTLISVYVVRLSITQVILFIFKSRIRLSRRVLRITVTRKVFQFSLIIAIYVLTTMIVNLFFGEPNVGQNLKFNNMHRELTCLNSAHFTVIVTTLFVITVYSGVQAYRARFLPKTFNDSNRYIYSCFTISIISIVYFPIFAGQNSHMSQELVNYCYVLLINSVELLVHYVSTVYTIFYRPDKNSKHEFRNVQLKACEKLAKKRCRLNMSAQQGQGKMG